MEVILLVKGMLTVLPVQIAAADALVITGRELIDKVNEFPVLPQPLALVTVKVPV